MPKPERDKAIASVAEMLQIGHLLDRKPSQLSGGQRQRVAMGRALVRDPQVFLFDEPLSNLDAKLRVDMRTEIKRLHQRMGTTIVYVTHDQIEAMTLATKIAVLKDGVAAAVRHAGGDLQQPGQHVRRRLHGLAGDEPDPGDDRGATATRWPSGSSAASGEPIALPLTGAPAGLAAFQGKQVIFGIRPEAMTDPDGADRNARASPPPTAISRSSSRPAPTPSPSPISAARRSWRGCAPTPTSSRARRRRSPSTSTRPCSSIRRREEPDRSDRPMASIPTSSSSAPASAARRSRPGLPAAAPRSSSSSAASACAATPETRDARSIFVDGHFRPEGDVARGRRRALQPRQLLLCRRQFEVLRRGADPLPQAKILPRWSISAASRRPGRFPMRSSSPGIRRPSSFSRCAARSATIRPSRSTRSPMPFRRCRTRRRSPGRAPS